jgi:hypothetical protein
MGFSCAQGIMGAARRQKKADLHPPQRYLDQRLAAASAAMGTGC